MKSAHLIFLFFFFRQIDDHQLIKTPSNALNVSSEPFSPSFSSSPHHQLLKKKPDPKTHLQGTNPRQTAKKPTAPFSTFLPPPTADSTPRTSSCSLRPLLSTTSPLTTSRASPASSRRRRPSTAKTEASPQTSALSAAATRSFPGGTSAMSAHSRSFRLRLI